MTKFNFYKCKKFVKKFDETKEISENRKKFDRLD